MIRRLAVIAIAAVSLAAVDVVAQCRGEFIACSQRRSNRLENATCRFTNTQDPYFIYAYDATAGQVLDIFLSSRDFSPLVAIYEENNDNAAAVDAGGTIAAIRFDVPRSGRYWILATAEFQNVTRGLFDLDLFCTTVCRSPFGTSATSVLSVPSGQRATVQVGVDGTPPFTFRWFDAARPGVTLGTTTSPSFTTEPLFTSTTINVEVANSCGRITLTAAVINVEPCAGPSFTIQPVSRKVKAGEFVVLTASAQGSAPLSYQWFRGTPPDTNRPVHLATNTNLTMVATPALAGSYFLRAANACGTAYSQPATVEVEGGSKRRAARH